MKSAEQIYKEAKAQATPITPELKAKWRREDEQERRRLYLERQARQKKRKAHFEKTNKYMKLRQLSLVMGYEVVRYI